VKTEMGFGQKSSLNTEKLTKILTWTLYLNILIIILDAGSSYLQSVFLTSLMEGWFKGLSRNQILLLAKAHESREGIVSIAIIASYLVCYFVGARWILISSRITHLSGANDLTISPGWSVGWYFIPIALWWKPYQAFKQIYQVSIQITDWSKVPIPSLLRWWWGLWVLTTAVTYAQFQSMRMRQSVESLQLMGVTEVLLLPCEIALNLIFLKIIKSISERHNGRDFQNKLIQNNSLDALQDRLTL